ncbi:hypothetical protein ACFYV7_32420 [Nocardia suismassiliense]|uniref:Uncharacterized protein n=1 Tax=Nocardia suismassiliense TaxID=2077092 RepID=A0ABW6R367_9NOCA
MRQFYRAVLLDDDYRLIGYVEPGARLMEHAWIGNHSVQGIERLLSVPARVVWARRQLGDENLYAAAASVAALRPPEHGCTGRYILNHDQLGYVDKAAAVEQAGRRRTHPLPILTAAGGAEPHALAGAWARDRISISDTVPDGFELWKFDVAELHQFQ